jgi:hypothetical protein
VGDEKISLTFNHFIEVGKNNCHGPKIIFVKGAVVGQKTGFLATQSN